MMHASKIKIISVYNSAKQRFVLILKKVNETGCNLKGNFVCFVLYGDNVHLELSNTVK